MVTVIGYRHEIKDNVLRTMYRARAELFGPKGWGLSIVDGEERDEFDDLNPIYIVQLSEHAEHLGSMRLMPTTGPTLTSKMFPDAPAAPSIWEASRLCSDGYARRVLRQMVLWAARHGVSSIIGVADEPTLDYYNKIGLEIDVFDRSDDGVSAGILNIGEAGDKG